MTIAITLLAMAAFRVWTRTGPRPAQPFIGPPAAALLILLSGLTHAEAGLVLAGFRYAVSTVLLIAAGYAVALLIPRARAEFAARDYPRPVRTALVTMPLATVVFEEVAFRGVLWALLARDHGPVWATGITAVLFGLWHLSVRPFDRASLGEVAFTTIAGVVLGVLRHLSGGLLAPFVAHWTANGLGILVSASVRHPGRDVTGEPLDPR